MTNPSCMNCVHCGVILDGAKQIIKVCRFLPPHVVGGFLPVQGGAQMRTMTTYPVVTEADWCSQFSPRIQIAT